MKFRQGLQAKLGLFAGGAAMAVAALVNGASADPVSGEIFFTRYAADSDPTRVGKVSFTYDGGLLESSFSMGAITTLATGIGADGIVGNPRQTSSVLIGGQTNTVYRVDRDGGGVLQTLGGLPGEAFHLTVPTSDRLLSTDIPGPIINSTAIGAGGILGATVGITKTLGSSDVTQVIATPYGYRYTTSIPNGNGSYGNLSFSDPTLTSGTYTTAAIHALLVAAHGGIYDPFSDTVIIMGEDHVTQLDAVTGAIIADLDLSALGGIDLDQGTADGEGHLVIADAGTGSIVFIDYAATGNISTYTHLDRDFLATFLDDVAPLVGEGSTVPEPGSLTLLGLGLAALGLARRRRRQ